MNLEGMKAKLAASAAKKPWYNIKNLSNDEVDLVIYDEISWFGITAQDFMRDLGNITASQINVRLSSPGGDIFDGLAISNALRAHRARVNVFVDGIAASIASVIAMAGDKITMMPHSQMMIHEGSGGCYGTASDMRKMGDLLDFQSDNIAGVYASRAGGTSKEWRARMQEETWYTAETAVELGLADEVASFPRREDETEETDPEEDEPYADKGTLLSFDPTSPVNLTFNINGATTLAPVELVEDPDPTNGVTDPEQIEEDPEPTSDPDPEPPPGFGGDWSDQVQSLINQSEAAWDDAVAHLTRRVPA